MKAGALVIVGGYGLVGGQAARLLRRRNPDLPLVLAGRRPEAARELAASLGASTAAMDVRAPRPLAALGARPSAVLATVTDPGDRLLADAMRRGIPIADVDRGGHARVLDAAVLAARERPRAPVLMSGSWMSGTTALVAAAAAREVGRAERIEIALLVSSDDRVGDDARGFAARLNTPYYAMRSGRRLPVQPLTAARRVRCADGRERPSVLVETLEQTTLPLTLGVPTVETRLAVQPNASLWGLVALKRSGALWALSRPSLQGLREALLHRSGRGDLTGFSVTAEGSGRTATIDVLDARGQAHLSAVGAAIAAERALALGGRALPAGISFAEQSARPPSDLASLRQAGAIVRSPAPLHPGPGELSAAELRVAVAPTAVEEDLSA